MRSHQLIVAIAVVIVLGVSAWRPNAADQPTAGAANQPEVELVCVDNHVPGYATFQSHNQKVVANRYGIFMTYLKSRNEQYTAQTWRLSRSTDGGKSFLTLYEATHATNPPVIESDPEGDLYLIRPDFLDGHAYLYRFLADREFREPVISQIPNGAHGKYAMTIDLARGRLYFFSANETFSTVSLTSQVLRSCRLLQPGPNAALQYPLLFLDCTGALHAAWTTQKHGQYLYWDIHHMMSKDGGETWQNLDGTKLNPPVVADDTGPATRIPRDDEFDVHTWLSSFIAKDGKVHFMYLAQTNPSRQHYMRYDIKTRCRDIDREPEFRGDECQIQSLDGFFTARFDQPDAPLYVVGRDPAGHIVCLVSCDNGTTWNDHARSSGTFNAYSIGGCRSLTPDGYIVGSFTDQQSTTVPTESASKIYFFKIKGG